MDKSYSHWTAECRWLYDVDQSLVNHANPAHILPFRNQSPNGVVIFDDVGGDTADESLSRLLLRIPESWIRQASVDPSVIWENWTKSYQQVAVHVNAPIWI